MATLPTPLKAALGLAATALDEARKLPETLPQASVVAVSTAMQVSLRVQQRIAALAARGEEVISQLRGPSAEPPDWATFDETPDQASAGGSRGIAAFDRVPEGSAGDPGEPEVGQSLADIPDRFEPAEVGGTESAGTGPGDRAVANPVAGELSGAGPAKPTKRAAKKATAAGKAAATKTTKISPAKAGPPPPDKASPAKASPAKAGPAKAAKASPAKPAKAAKASPAKPAKASPAKTGPVKRASVRSEPLTAAAKRAKPSAAPNPATMAAEIVHAHQAAGQDGTGPAQLPGAGSGTG